MARLADGTNNVVRCFGSGVHEGHPFIVMENLSGGTLVERMPKLNTHLQKVNVVLSIARALQHVHTSCLPGYIVMHRDLKPTNVALDSENNCKLVDFGLARVIETRAGAASPDFEMGRRVDFAMHLSEGTLDSPEVRKEKAKEKAKEKEEKKGKKEEEHEEKKEGANSYFMSVPPVPRVDTLNLDDLFFEMTGETGSLRYMAPEVGSNETYNHKADVYSWAVVAWQVFTKSTPYTGFSVQKFQEHVVTGGYRMPLPSTWPAGLAPLVSKAWAKNAKDRPNMREIVEALEGISEELAAKKLLAEQGGGGCGGCSIF